MKRNDNSPETYRADVTGEQSEMLEFIRSVILELAPGTSEEIGYGMLSYPGIGHLAAQKHYVSLYVEPTILAAHADAFPGVNCGKSCIRLKKREQIDESGLRRVLSY